MLIRAMDINDLERIVELEHILFTSFISRSEERRVGKEC